MSNDPTTPAYTFISLAELDEIKALVGPDHPFVKRCEEHFASLLDAIDNAYRNAASWGPDGVEVDGNALVSRSDDPGAYVMAWIWVSREAAGLGEPQPDSSLDTSSSASRQHYIDTGQYLKHGEAINR